MVHEKLPRQSAPGLGFSGEAARSLRFITYIPMKTRKSGRSLEFFCHALTAAFLVATASSRGQMLINVDFGVGAVSPKKGLAATGAGTNDFWNLYRHYEPKFTPGMPLVANGQLDKLKQADGSETDVSMVLSNAPGVWGNSSGDPMYDTYIFSQNGSNITVSIRGLAAGRYHFVLYGHADADVSGEQNSSFTLKSGTNEFGPLAATGGNGWKASNPWQERAQYVVFRDVPVERQPIVIEVGAGPNGVAVLNGLQIVSHGTGPPRLLSPALPEVGPSSTNLWFREVRYEGRLSDAEARFAVSIEVESMTTNEISALLFEGDVALVASKLPEGLRLAGRGRQTRLICAAAGARHLELELLARITRAEPWNQISFNGPAAAMSSVSASAAAVGVEIQLLSGTSLTPATKASSSVQGQLGLDRTLALRWQSKTAEVTRKSLISAETVATAQITPTVIKFTTRLNYQILQAPAPRLAIELPDTHALTRIQGDQIRDWQVRSDGDRQVLTVEFVRPIEKTCALTLFSEQSAPVAPLAATLMPPQPLEVEHESGSFTLSADDTTVEIDATPGLRQVNPPAGALASYRFSGRPIAITAKLERIQPVVKLEDHATARVEESRLLISHGLNLVVEKAGIYALELIPQPGFVVSEAKGEGIEDWKFADGKLNLTFTNRVLGARKIEVHLEEARPEFPERVTVLPLGVPVATKVTTLLGVSSSPGIRLKTSELTGLREAPIASLPNHLDEALAFAGDVADWKLALAAERLSPRIVTEVFNLVTVGDGLVGGSATIRYGILNQGVQQFSIALPAHWKNVEFTGANIRRKEQLTNVWNITLQDKAWGAYTLVITYDYQFDPKGGTLDLAGAHTLGVEREAGSLGVMTAASLKLTPPAPADPLRRVDESELSESDRALCTRPLLLAYKYTGGDYHHSVPVTRFEELSVLDAVADRTELTTVLTEAGQLLTQSSFMVKNAEKQFQKFKLPANAAFWSSFVNGQPAKPEKDGDWLLVPLPRDVSRDQAFAVDIVYAQTSNVSSSWFPRRFELAAPLTDIPNTYAEWQLFVPVTQRLSGFGGNMTVASGTTYDFRDAWQAFVQFYGNLIEQNGGLVGGCVVAGLAVVIIGAASRRGFRGALTVVLLFSILAILAAMMLPALSRAKMRAQRINAMSNLKQIGVAAKTWATDNNGSFPPTLDALKAELGTDRVRLDPNTGQPFIYVGSGKSEANPQAIVAYSPSDLNGRAVLLADGSVQLLSPDKFQEALGRDAVAPQVGAPINLLTMEAQRQAQTPQQVQQPVPLAAPAPAPPAPSAVAAEARRMPASAAASNPADQAPLSGLRGGGFGGGSLPPMAAGLRPIRIEVPRAGQAFTFTKVLNANREPLTVTASILRVKVYHTEQMFLQVTGFLAGLLLLWRLAARPARSSLGMALATLLILSSVASLLALWRVLHLGLIVAAPAFALGLIGWWGCKLWRHRQTMGSVAPPAEPPMAGPTGGPAPGASGAVLVAFITLAASAAFGQDGPLATNSNAVSILSATYSGTVADAVAQFDVAFEIATAATNQFVPLFGPDVAVQAYSSQGAARLVLEGGAVGVRVAERTRLSLQFKILAKLGGEATRRQLAFGIPSALASRVNLVIDEPEAEVEFPMAVALERSGTNQQTRVQAVLGAVDRLELIWTPRIKHAAEIAATVFVQQSALVTLGGGVVNTRSRLDYQVSQGELKQVRVEIPASHRLLRVDGDSIRTWEVAGNLLTVELVKGVSPAYKLELETEKALSNLPASAQVEIPRVLDVKRETGLIAVRAGEELSLTVENAGDLQRVDSEEFHRGAPELADGVAHAFRFLKPGFVLSVRADPIKARIEAVGRNTVWISPESVRLIVRIDYTIKGAGVFALRLALPADYRLDEVTGANVSQWAERNDGARRLLEVTLKERTLGAYSLGICLSRNYAEPPKSLAIPSAHPLDADKLSGFVTVASEQGVAAKTESIEGLAEIPVATVPGEGVAGVASALAYKFISAAPGQAPAWKLRVGIEAVDPWVRAEIMNTLTLTETLVSGRTLVKYSIANAPTREFRVRIPPAFKNVELTGPQIRRRDETNGEWRVELQGKVRGEYVLVATWEMPREPKSGGVELESVQALGVERETGFVSVMARPPLQVTDKSHAEFLSRIDARELPEWPGPPDTSVVLVFRYLRPGYKLSLEAQRFEPAEVLQALIDSARFTTVVADDGQMLTEVSLNVRNNGRQHLAVQLPPGTTVWSAFVSGDPVRPSANNTRLLIPMAREIASEAPTLIELTYIGAVPFPASHGRVALVSPGFDMPLKNAHWDLYLPPDYDYSKFDGSMNRAIEASAPVIQSFSISEYNVQQQAQEAQQKSELRNGLQSARENLSNGNLRQALTSFKRSQSRGQQFKAAAGEDRDLKEVEKDLRRAQGSNLIVAQNNYYYDNAGKFGGGQVFQQRLGPGAAAEKASAPTSQAGNLFLNYDADVAGQQWEKLEKAQEVAVAKVAPLRVNLPTRGLRYAFTQVLQTEVSKPMTIGLFAENTKAPSWTNRLVFGLAGFVALWVFFAWVAPRKTA